MRHFLVDYEFVMHTGFQLQGMEQIPPEDEIRLFFPDEQHKDEFVRRYPELNARRHTRTMILPESTEICLVSLISYLLGVFWCESPGDEIIILAKKELFSGLLRAYPESRENIFVYSSYMRYVRHTWKRERNIMLSRLPLKPEQKEQVAFWVRRAYCISDPGRRKYKTHNRIEAIIGNGELLRWVYADVRPFLE